MADPFPPKIGKYEVQGIVGEGGFGRVYRAFDPTVGRPVAIKVLTAQSSTDLLARFQNEATAAGNLNHPNIVTVYEFGIWDGAPYIAMQFLDGLDLNQVMTSGQAVSLLDKVRIMTEVGRGLQCAHENGVVHRDVKPANIKVMPSGTVKMMDFGIARLTRVDSTRLTQRGDLIGTIRYMCPEQFSGCDVDALGDIFAYGVIYYEFVAGVHPFEASDMPSFMYKITGSEPAPLAQVAPGCPLALSQIVMRALEKDRDLRYQSLEDILLDTRPVLLELQRERAAELLALAHNLFASGEMVRGLALVKEILDLDPNNSEAWELRERIQQSMHRMSIRPKIEALMKAADNYGGRRQFSMVIESLESAQRLDPSDTNIVRKLAVARQQSEGAMRAERLLGDAARELEQRNLTLAERLSSEALKDDPTNSKAADFVETVRTELRQRDQERRLKLALDDARRLAAVEDLDAAIERLAAIGEEDDPGGQAAAMRAGLNRQREERARAERRREEKRILRGLLKESRWADALIRLEPLCAEFPDDVDFATLFNHAQERLAALRQADDVRTASAEAASLEASGEFARAEEVMRRLAAKYPDDSDIRFMAQEAARLRAEHERAEARDQALGKIQKLRSEDRFEEARSALDAAQREFGEDEGFLEERKQLDAEWSVHRQKDRARRAVDLARANIAEGSIELALRYLKQAFDDDPQNSDIEPLLREARRQAEMQRANRAIDQICSQARERASARDFDAAIAVLQEALRAHPGEPRIEGLLDAVYSQKREWESELRQQESARRADALERAISDIRSAVSQRRIDEAVLLLERHSKEFSADPAFRALISEVAEASRKIERETRIAEAVKKIRGLLNQGNRTGALQVCRAAISRDPDAAELVQLLSGIEQQDAQDRREAEAARQHETESAFSTLEGAIHGRDWPRADRQLAAAAALAPGSPRILEARERIEGGKRRDRYVRDARAALQEERFDDAESLLTRVIADHPGDAEASELLRRVRSARAEADAAAAIRQRRQQARTLAKDHNFDEAIRVLRELLARYGVQPEVEQDLAQVSRQAEVHRTLLQLQERRDAGDARTVQEGATRILAAGDSPEARALLEWSQIALAPRPPSPAPGFAPVPAPVPAPEVAAKLPAAPEAQVRPFWKKPIVIGAAAAAVIATIVMLKLFPHPTPPQISALVASASVPRQATVGQPYAGSLPASGGVGPYRWTISNNTLPPGLSLDAATGDIRGTPANEGAFDFSIRVSDQAGQTVDTALSVSIAPKPAPPGAPLQLDALALPPGALGADYVFQMQATGGEQPYAWSILKAPPGLTVDGSGTLRGKPLRAGSFEFQVRVRDSAGATVQQAFTLSVPAAAAVEAPQIVTSSLPEGMVGRRYTFVLQGEKGKRPYSWSLSGDALPPDLRLNSATGEISGTPSAAGQRRLTIHLSDAASRTAVSQPLSLVVQPEAKPPQKLLCPQRSSRVREAGYTDLLSGSITWSGTARAGEPVVISGDRVQGGGSLTSRSDLFTGAPIKITESTPGTKIQEPPSKENGWSCIAFVPAAGSAAVTIKWVVDWGH